MNQEFISDSVKDTKNFARDFAKRLGPGDILALYGTLGAGKTAFIQGLVESLGYEGKVFSPTFIFVRPYQIGGRKSKIKVFYHIDLYRIEKPADLRTIGVEEFLNEKGAVSAIEWPEKIEKSLPSKATKIKIEVVDETTRKITVNG
ncbi:tRNA (adenosine(37)-N6)-threonylcarbamoyltransferase complex ATPase subunit type 1 TsaE [Patescibacteria group bacterium]|nr:tRNA (adenosine(37)-N6)-threonylcarbamoyltransferase complex ATPase subunit type 1 TsaE [Patescibacteria group bacterium]